MRQVCSLYPLYDELHTTFTVHSTEGAIVISDFLHVRKIPSHRLSNEFAWIISICRGLCASLDIFNGNEKLNTIASGFFSFLNCASTLGGALLIYRMA